MKTTNTSRLILTSIVIASLFAGCSKDHLDPSQIGRFRPIPAVNIILDTLGVAEETASAYEGAEEPRPSDVVPYEQDYRFGPGDIIRISIFELLQEGYPYVDNFVVNESGNISIPEIGQIQAGGLTESQLEDEIRNALTPGILKNPSVTVLLQQSENRIFSILGDGIPNPNRYPIPRNDFRLLDALAVAGSAAQFNVSYIYVTRRVTSQEQFGTVPAGTSANGASQGDNLADDFNDKQMLEVIEPSVMTSQLVVSHAEMAAEDELEKLAMPEEITANQNDEQLPTTDKMPMVQDYGEIKWEFKDGRWIPVQTGKQAGKPAEAQKLPQQKVLPVPNGPESLPERYGVGELTASSIQNRVIKIPKDKLFGGDPRYNIIIRPGDIITVQLDVVGEYYILGNVNNQGIVNLTGRPMTLKMAIAAAGGLGPLAWPKKCEVIRRIGEKKEEIVMVDLEKIANGTQPDFFIKPNDVINVGTHGVSRYLAVLRNAFRATYGFGFIYDRNYADRTLGFEHPLSPFFGY